MQWVPVKVSSNRDDFPMESETVLGLWSDEFWDQVMYSRASGWYSPETGTSLKPPGWWARVDSTIPKVSEVGEVGPVCEEGPLGPDASVMERVRKFLEALIEVRDHYSNSPDTGIPERDAYACYDDWAADKAAELLKMISLLPVTPSPIQVAAGPPLALDVSLEKARALHRVWRALNDGDCPRCHRFHAATEILRSSHAIACPACLFRVTRTEIEAIEKMFAPAMDAAVEIFDKWRDEINNNRESSDEVGCDK